MAISMFPSMYRTPRKAMRDDADGCQGRLGRPWPESVVCIMPANHPTLGSRAHWAPTVARDQVGCSKIGAANECCDLVECLATPLLIADRDTLDRELLLAQSRPAHIARGAAAQHLADGQLGPVEGLPSRPCCSEA
eukprot:scaffold189005_cov30-Tisochrysis_lutea.AAC.2